MFDPFDSEDDASERPRPPFPTPTGALLLTFGASFAALAVATLLFEQMDILALGVGTALGMGGVATIAARFVPEPQADRIGLHGFSPRHLPTLLCLVPLVFVTSELDNLGRELDRLLPVPVLELPAEAVPEVEPAGEGADVPDPRLEGTAEKEPPAGPAATGMADAAASVSPGVDEADAASATAQTGRGTQLAPIVEDAPEGWELVQIGIFTLGIAPVVEGFLFYGVILQGLVAWIGRARGLLLTGCLYALVHAFGAAASDGGVFQALAAVASFIGLGIALGVCRLATGSVLAPIVVDTGFKAVALVALTSPDWLVIPGYNVGPDAHTPLGVLVPSIATVFWGLYALTRRSQAAAS